MPLPPPPFTCRNHHDRRLHRRQWSTAVLACVILLLSNHTSPVSKQAPDEQLIRMPSLPYPPLCRLPPPYPAPSSQRPDLVKRPSAGTSHTPSPPPFFSFPHPSQNASHARIYRLSKGPLVWKTVPETQYSGTPFCQDETKRKKKSKRKTKQEDKKTSPFLQVLTCPKLYADRRVDHRLKRLKTRKEKRGRGAAWG